MAELFTALIIIISGNGNIDTHLIDNLSKNECLNYKKFEKQFDGTIIYSIEYKIIVKCERKD